MLIQVSLNQILIAKFGETEEIIDLVEKQFKKFKSFDMELCLPFDHHFIPFKTKPINIQRLAKMIQKEWEVLKTSLPSSIFVRAYGERINLMRADIAGLEGNPFCHGLFFFDIFIPSSYSAQPPEIFFHKPHPHPPEIFFKRDKRLSLDLLWNSHKKQTWNPTQPGILQVLVTIQQEVLNGMPYSDESKSRTENRNKKVFMLSCEAMLHTLQSPPRHFEDLVYGHFRKQAHPILLIFKKQINVSNEKAMNPLFFRLLKAFEWNGTYCRHKYNIAIKEAMKKEESS